MKDKTAFIWNVTNDCLRNIFKPHEYGKVILPLVVIKRFNDCNMSNNNSFTFSDLLEDKENIKQNLKDYLNGFSDDVKDIIDNFEFMSTIDKLDKNEILYYVLEKFNDNRAYFGLDEVSTTEMGYIFEELVNKFSISGEKTGEHFTAKDVVELLTDILLIDYLPSDENKLITCYDQTMGTSQMLTVFKTKLKELDENIEIEYFGQELNPETYAIAKCDALIKNENIKNLRKGNTLSDDKFKGYKFDYIISNPPYGVDWKVEKDSVKKDNRFKVGLPRTSDGQMLFILNGLDKLKDNGRMAIIHSGSVLFTGDAGSGESEIRRYLIENDLLETIIQLPKDLFYNTGISTYILIINKQKSENRKGEIQLIDASKCFEKRKKAIGNKRVDITNKAKELILWAYNEEICIKNKKKINDMEVKTKWCKNEEFGFYKITVERPKRDEQENIVYKKGKPVPDSELRDTETVPLSETIEEYMVREVLPYAPDAWVDETKTKIGYEIPFTRHFYEYIAPRPSHDILTEIMASEEKMMVVLKELLGHE